MKLHHGIEIDTGAIEMKSLRNDRIELPYTGRLPAGADSEQPAFIVIKPTFEQLVVGLKWKDVNGGNLFAVLDADYDEITDMLDGYLVSGQKKGATGLTPYWEGSYATAYAMWRRLYDVPARLCDFLKHLPADKREAFDEAYLALKAYQG